MLRENVVWSTMHQNQLPPQIQFMMTHFLLPLNAAFLRALFLIVFLNFLRFLNNMALFNQKRGFDEKILLEMG
jgi:hypothetical protein